MKSKRNSKSKLRWGWLFIVPIIVVLLLNIPQPTRILSADDESLLNEISERLSRLEPTDVKIIYDHELLIDRDLSKFDSTTYDLEKIFDQGSRINFANVYYDEKWERPAYHPNLYSENIRWSYIPTNLAFQQHKMFIYQGGISNWYDLSHRLCLPDEDFGNSPIHEMAFTNEYPYVTRLIVFDAKIRSILHYENQLLIVVEPKRNGLHMIDFEHKQLPKEKIIMQMVTPDGYELDYLLLREHS